MDSSRRAQLQYGYHISSLNSSASSLICAAASVPPSRKGLFSLPTCLDMTDSAFGLITSAYTVGGLGGSLNAGGMIERWGKKGTAVRSAGVIGALAVSLGSDVWILVVGRILIGVSCGIATVLVPLYLSSVTPPAIAGSIGILTQISINVGIFAAQGFSIPLSTPGTGNWRLVSLISAGLAVVQILTGPLVPESREKEHKVHDSDADEERAPLAADEGDDEADSLDLRRKGDDEKSLSVAEVLKSRNPTVAKAMWTLVATMVFQQFSGINAVMYYSTSILTAVNPASAKTVSLLVTLVNLIMTFPAIFLIDRLGRRSLLLTSLSLMCLSTALLGWSINNRYFRVASGGIMAFVVSFALGLGPVPFVMVGELPPREAKSATASIAVAVNWISNLVIGLCFLPLRDYLAYRTGGAGDDGEGSGTVFYVFTAWTALGVGVLARLMR
ncbi:MFS glucose transporter [Rhodotorula toruloides]|uniref:MFS glucose transporter n=1 Tax=Rhodotorula toruloides TaxID=5286 RepID=A0A511K8H1_RHOTO|nr:MFS glucose transporter [Rhodotorula toruloides]